MQVEIIEDFMNRRIELALLLADPWQLQRVTDEIALGAAVSADADVVAHGEAREQRNVLERAADADLCNLLRLILEDAGPLHQDLALARLIEPAQAVEQRRLARAVRSDQAQDLALLHIERHAIQRNDATEHDAHVANGEQGSLPPAPVPASCRCSGSRAAPEPCMAPRQPRLSVPLDTCNLSSW
jgi:hypothetical protein